jgi:RimJ/RimL family protein N-acetyltransferase
MERMTDLRPQQIASPRLDLIPISVELYQALIEEDWDRAEELTGLSGMARWEGQSRFLKMRLKQLEDDPSLGEWLGRLVIVREKAALVGRIGFHTGPEPDYLRELGLEGIEFGYKIFAPFRRRGYAKEAVYALMQWARDARNVSVFVLSIAPDNNASLALAKNMGFRKVSSHVDEVDGPEDIYTLRYR